ncbi:MAG: homoserine dehydrogenase [Ardenticatenales bacterium]|nr:homoserine dehydrogenase [Ardenticatenales bacterium]
MEQVDIFLHGVGHVGRLLLMLIERQAELLAARHGLRLRVVGAVDSRGGLFVPEGIAPSALLDAKRTQGSVAALPGGVEGLTAVDCLQQAQTPLTLLESTLVELETGGPGLLAMRAALQQGHSVVSANKGPLVLAFAELEALAAHHGGGLAYSATVCGGLPAVNMGRYDLAHATILQLEGVVNSTTNYILSEMEQGRDFAVALQKAQADGIAEADPTLDVSGWDAANKLIILANSVLRQSATATDVTVCGIEAITAAQLQEAAQAGTRIKLVASAKRDEGGHYRLSVEPRALPMTHPLATMQGHQMGLWVESDINGTIFLTIIEETPEPTAAAMLRDIVLLTRGRRGW